MPEEMESRSFRYDLVEFFLIVGYVGLPLVLSLGLFVLLYPFHKADSWPMRLLGTAGWMCPLALVPAAFKMARRRAAESMKRQSEKAQQKPGGDGGTRASG